MIGWVLVLVLAVVVVISFVRAKHHDQPYRAMLAAYRSALAPGLTREKVEDYLREREMPYQRSCCEPGEFSDLTRIGAQAPHWFCRKQNIYLEFKFNHGAQGAEVARGSDILKEIDLFEDRSCW